MGSIPLYGTHTPIILGLCFVLRLDGVVGWVGTQISNPFFSPFLLVAEAQVGSLLLERRPLDFLDVAQLEDAGFSGMLRYIFVGAPVVAAGLAATTGLATYALLSLRRRRRTMSPPSASSTAYRLPADAPRWWFAIEEAAREQSLASPPGWRRRIAFHRARGEMLGDDALVALGQALEGMEAGSGPIGFVGGETTARVLERLPGIPVRRLDSLAEAGDTRLVLVRLEDERGVGEEASRRLPGLLITGRRRAIERLARRLRRREVRTAMWQERGILPWKRHRVLMVPPDGADAASV